MSGATTCPRRALRALAGLAVLAASLLALAAPASAYVQPTSGPPFDGTPISHGPRPDVRRDLVRAARPRLEHRQPAGRAARARPVRGVRLPARRSSRPRPSRAGVPERTDVSGHQASPTPAATSTASSSTRWRRRSRVAGYNNWLAYRRQGADRPDRRAGAARSRSATNVKIPIFIENNIHGDEEEGADSMMQIIRDLVTMPRGTHPTVDNFLDHAILITIPSQNPDGRFIGHAGERQRLRHEPRLARPVAARGPREHHASRVEWLAPVMFATHGYVNPTLIDGLTKPHNPGLEYDIFAYWNQRRLDENRRLARIGQGITRPGQRPADPTGQRRHVSRGTARTAASPAQHLRDLRPSPPAASQTGTTVTVTTTGSHRASSVGQTRRRLRRRRGRLQRRPFRVTSVLSPTQFTYELARRRPARIGRRHRRLQTGPGQAEGWDDLGSVLHPDLRRLLRRRRLHARDVQQLPRLQRPAGLQDRPVRRLLVVGRLLDRESRRRSSHDQVEIVRPRRQRRRRARTAATTRSSPAAASPRPSTTG